MLDITFETTVLGMLKGPGLKFLGLHISVIKCKLRSYDEQIRVKNNETMLYSID